jgi:hypothetical protein
MHPDLVGALARQRTEELPRPAEFRHTDARPTWFPEPAGAEIVRRMRRHLGGALLDVGLHLMATR